MIDVFDCSPPSTVDGALSGGRADAAARSPSVGVSPPEYRPEASAPCGVARPADTIIASSASV